MTPDRLLELYDRISEAPDAVSRLRRFVLDLAVRGKLVEQDPEDEPASELLERIAAEKAASRKRQKDVPGIDQHRLRELPSAWAAAPLIALGDWAIGSGFPKNEQGKTDGPYLFLKVSDMSLPGNEKYIRRANNYIDGEAAKRTRATIHPPGTIIFPKIGGAIATNKRRILTRGSAIDNNCLGLAFSPQIDTEWAYLLMTTLDFTLYQSGTAVPALQQGTLAAIPVAIPPLAEQHRIVAKVDELMALCDRLEEQHGTREATRERLTTATLSCLTAPDTDEHSFRNHARFALDTLPPLTARPDQIKALRQTILDLAVRGKLVKQNPEDEPALNLLEQIDAERAQLGIKSNSVAIDTGEVPFPLPPKWSWTRIGQICTKTGSGSTPRGGKSSYKSSGIPFLRSQNVHNDGLRLNDVALIDQQTHERMSDTKVLPDDLLLNITGGSIGRCCHVPESFGEANISQHVAIIRPAVSDIGRFLHWLVLSPYFQAFVVGKQTGAGRGGLPKNRMDKIPIALPPVPEQHRIVAKVDKLMVLCDQLEASLNEANTKRARLLESLLAEPLLPAGKDIEVA